MATPTAPFSEIASAVKAWSGPAWLTETRSAAIERFALAGLPTTRLEGWRTTPMPDFRTAALFPGFASTANKAKSVVEPLDNGRPDRVIEHRRGADLHCTAAEREVARRL